MYFPALFSAYAQRQTAPLSTGSTAFTLFTLHSSPLFSTPPSLKPTPCIQLHLFGRSHLNFELDLLLCCRGQVELPGKERRSLFSLGLGHGFQFQGDAFVSELRPGLLHPDADRNLLVVGHGHVPGPGKTLFACKEPFFAAFPVLEN